MHNFSLTNGISAHICRVGEYVEVKLLQTPSLEMTNQLCSIKDGLLKAGVGQNILVTLDALSFTSNLAIDDLSTLIIEMTLDQWPNRNKSIVIDINYNGRDVGTVCEKLNISRRELIALHTSGKYYVAMLGFLPGFPYIAGLPPQLQLPRKSQADDHVPPGSVALAMQYTGIYPQQSPGGWHIIGHTIFKNFDLYSNPPFKLEVGDSIQFKSLGI